MFWYLLGQEPLCEAQPVQLQVESPALTHSVPSFTKARPMSFSSSEVSVPSKRPGTVEMLTK